MASNAFSSKAMTVDVGSMVFHMEEFSYSGGNHEVETTNEDSGQAEEFVHGIAKAIRFTGSGMCDATTSPIAPTALVSVSLYDGIHMKAFNAVLTEFTVSGSVKGRSEVSLAGLEAVA